MKYHILPYTYTQAKRIGVKISPSDNTKYKLQIFNKNGDFITYCGANGYSDYPTYIKTHGKTYADQRRKLYKLRHQKDRHIKGTRGWYADQLLW